VSAINRVVILQLVSDSVAGGCRQAKACEAIGVSERRLQRWIISKGKEDQRHGPKTESTNKLTLEEKSRMIAIASSKEFCDLSPHQIVPKLADRGVYIASESSFYRVLKAKKLLKHRGRSKPKTVKKIKGHEVFAPLKLLSWDITYLHSCVQGQYFYLYLFLDVFSRKAVGWEIYDKESAEYSSILLNKICLDEDIEKNSITLHSDNGSPMKGATMLVTMQRLGVVPSFSRPAVSNDNPFSESLFKTLKYCPQYPSKPFTTIDDAKEWVKNFICWYNTEHLHSAISFTTPASRHCGEDKIILEKRDSIYKVARQKNPNRWSGKTRNWEKINRVRLNWLKEDMASDTAVNISCSS
jgi:transposase InsO family protein